MKDNGIVRRIDELGRIVIPKELRRTMRIRVGDEMEISASGDTLTLRKYSGIEAVEPAAKAVAALLSESTGADAIFTDSSRVIIADGKNKNVYSGAKLTEKFSEQVTARKPLVLHDDDVKDLFEGVTRECAYVVVEQIIVQGDFAGALVLVLDTMPSDVARAYLYYSAELLKAVLAQ